MTHQRPRRIFRVRTGCLTCRHRKKKCDETTPICRACVRNELTCCWPAKTAPGTRETRPAAPIRQKPVAVTAASPVEAPSMQWKLCAPATGDTVLLPPLEDRDTYTRHHPSPSPLSSSSSRVGIPSPERPIVQLSHLDTVAPQEQATDPESIDHDSVAGSTDMQLILPSANPLAGRVLRGPVLLPECSERSQELLSYYLSTTATSMANGSTSDNPFLVQFIPLAFSSDLVLQLILTQSAAHRSARLLIETDNLADQYYNNSLRLFRQTVSGYINGTQVEPTTLLVGALIMCFTETAKGDINGTIFDHLMAANSLLIEQLASNRILSKALKDFLVEYYVYTATLSMVSVDARISPQFFLGQELEATAQELVTTGYVGNLCGCWLDLILQIRSIFQLGRRVMTSGTIVTADDFVLFSRLHARILRWTPSPLVCREVQLAGSIFQQAMLLYLYTSLNVLSHDDDGLFASSIRAGVAEGLSYLAQLSPEAQINTSLCWPIAIIGSCITDTEEQNMLRQRLKVMFNIIGLGNIRQTLILLDRMWKLSTSDAGPWNICQVMRENQIWISFA